MSLFYFTYGLEGQPFAGGWTEVEAAGIDSAIAAFRLVHPDKQDGIVNCAAIYEEKEFTKTSMYENGNYGKRKQERIKVSIEQCDGSGEKG